MNATTSYANGKSQNGKREILARNSQETPEGRILPKSEEAERAVIGSMIRDNRQILDCLEILTEEDFYAMPNRVAFRAIREIHLEKRGPADLVTLADWLNARQSIQDCSYAYLAQLFDSAPSAVSATHYAQIVAGKAKLRELAIVCREIESEVYDQSQEPQAVLEQAERAIYAVNHSRQASSTASLETLVLDAANRADARKASGGIAFGLGTGFHNLDQMTNGLQPGEVIVVAGRTSVGKTAFVINLFRNIVVDGKRAIFFSLEQSLSELTDRLLCLDGLIESQRFKRGNLSPGEEDRFMSSMDRLRAKKSWINDSPGRTVLQMFAECRRLKVKAGLDAIFVDYLQIVQPASKREPREQQIAGISRDLKMMARELKVPVIVAAQLNRQAENARPKLSDLRESGAIEQDADAVIFLHDPNRNEQTQGERGDGDIEVILAKQRNGPTGDFLTHFVRKYTKFFNFGEVGV